jgi:hypothetical protein
MVTPQGVADGRTKSPAVLLSWHVASSDADFADLGLVQA